MGCVSTRRVDIRGRPAVASNGRSWKLLSLCRRRGTRYFAGAAVAAASLLATAMPVVAATPSTLAVVVVGGGGLVSRPAGIACPGTCTATFAAGTSVVLTPQAKNGSRFLRWGGSCTGAGACTVKISGLTAVAAQFVGGPRTQPPPQPTTNQSVAVPGLLRPERPGRRLHHVLRCTWGQEHAEHIYQHCVVLYALRRLR